VILFVQPFPAELSLAKDILMVFGETSGLVTNFSKCFFTPNYLRRPEVQYVQNFFPCNLVQFPCKYLDLPLAVKKLSKAIFYPLIEAIVDRLPGWKASLIHPTRWATMVKAILLSIPIYHQILLHCPKWVTVTLRISNLHDYVNHIFKRP
jgi:hypothetical protein